MEPQDIFKIQDTKIGIGLVVLLLQLFLYINASSLFGPQYAPVVEKNMLIYIVMQGAILGVLGAGRDIVTADLDRLVNFIVIFSITSFLLLAIPLTVSGWGMDIGATLSAVVTQIVAVAYTEELVFREVLPQYIDYLPSAAIFGVFHWSVYGGSIVLIGLAVFLGLVFSVIKIRFGTMGATGAHAAWNLKAMGILDSIIGGAV